jgi:bisdemethoxycurcumin synthase
LTQDIIKNYVRPVERPLFEIVLAAQTIILETEDSIVLQITKSGLRGSSTHHQLPVIIVDHVERCLVDTFSSLGIQPKWNDLFWVVHPG